MGITTPAGFRAGAVHCGLKTARGAQDLTLIVGDDACTTAGMFTTNRICAAPVTWCRQRVAGGRARAVVVNSGNANACTGEQGRQNVARTAAHVAETVGCTPEDVLVASTGIIGHQLPMGKIRAGVDAAAAQLSRGPDADLVATRGIMTTDTRPKQADRTLTLAAGQVHLGGMVKGAGMIAPHLATMLGFITTDARIAAPVLQRCLADAVRTSFNAVTIDMHMSTNDTALVLASGASGVEVPPGGPEEAQFAEALAEVCTDLARQMAADGEGATKLVEVRVTGLPTEAAAEAVAKAVANSYLVKTAIHGADPNWGRITSAAGYAGVEFEPADLSVRLCDVPIFAAGEPVGFDANALSKRMHGEHEIAIDVTFTLGSASYTCWTCDLSKDYITINADYHT